MIARISYSLIFVMLISCSSNSNSDQVRLKAIEEIKKAEHDFALAVKSKGADSAFILFAAEDAVLDRGQSVVKGREAILKYFSSRGLQNVVIEWSPEFVDASMSGDLGYTFGPYTYSAVDSTGKPFSTEGIFHTVWKKQSNGEWLFVWD